MAFVHMCAFTMWYSSCIVQMYGMNHLVKQTPASLLAYWFVKTHMQLPSYHVRGSYYILFQMNLERKFPSKENESMLQ